MYHIHTSKTKHPRLTPCTLILPNSTLLVLDVLDFRHSLSLSVFSRWVCLVLLPYPLLSQSLIGFSALNDTLSKP
ncbi:hypothetical protein VIGAN_09175000 [Vigna angularis var. angularis]|uniref:Uncharacterized protein n=1 Tax=Vigna angularis var. angularis TaxID=157739 RepID=A0A0S3SZG5_PHAAN|nr:hypothetical protein VIGAN_09175000 [Vigna angularis var. angularis]